MGLGKMLTRSVPIDAGTRYDVVDMSTDVTLDSFRVFGNIAPDWPTTAYRSGMTVPGAWRASLLLSGLLAGSPWHAYRKPVGDDPSPRLVLPAPALLEQPNPPEIAFSTWRSLMLDYLWEGNAIGVYAARDRQGFPTAVIPVPASMVMVRYVDERNYPLPPGSIEYLIGNMSFSPQEIMHVKGPAQPGQLRGMGVLETQLSTIRGAQSLNADAHMIKGVPTGVLKSDNPDLTQPEAEKMKAGWLLSQQRRTVAVLNASTSFEPLAWNPQEAQLIEARQFSLSEIELMFGLPVGWLGGKTSSRTYSNIEQDAINLLKFTLGDHLTAFKQTISQCFPRGMYVEPDLDALLASDTMSRYQAYAVATAGKPWLLPNEVRAKERLQQIPGLDDTAPAPAVAPPAQPTEPPAGEIQEIEA